MRSLFLAVPILGLLLLSGCGLEVERPGVPTATNGPAPVALADMSGGVDESTLPTAGLAGAVASSASGKAGVLPLPSGERAGPSPEYELISLRRDGWDVSARVATPLGVRDVHFAVRLDGERFVYSGEVRDGESLVWRQVFDATLDGSVLQVEETDGVDLLRFEVLAGDRENYTLVLADGEVREYSVPVGGDDMEGWREFWPVTGLDWNSDGALCNALAQGRVLREEVTAALRATHSAGDPLYLHPLLEQVCNLLRACVTMKCRAGGNANQICLDCMVGDAGCELLRLIFG